MGKYYLAVDIGASSGRHIIAEIVDGKIVLEEVYRFWNGMDDVDGSLCWDVNRLFKEIITGLKKCKEIGKIPSYMGIDTWGVDFVFIGEDGQILRNPRAYRDPHTFSALDDYLRNVRTKKELYDYLLEHQGFIFRNTDNPYLAQMAGDLKTIAYTTGKMPGGTNLVGEYNAENVSAAICVGEYFSISREQALEAIRQYVPTNNRSQKMQTANNQLIVDAYNANPTSMQAAINAFKGDTFILGAMRELGEYTHLEHQNVVNMLAERKADLVYLVGEEYRLTTSPYPIFDTVEELHAFLQTNPLEGKHILLKGSRSTRMEKLLDIL